jgi:cadmium resistance protein CadD (predicted permease)
LLHVHKRKYWHVCSRNPKIHWRDPDAQMTSWIAATAFLATNVDDLFLLTLWFVKRSRFTTVLLGQLLGFSAILFLGLLGYGGLRLLPESAVHWLGLAPIAIGIKQLLSSIQTDSQVQVESAWSVAIITFANGADNLAVYIPLFGKLAPWQVGAVAAIFYLLLFLLVIAAQLAASRLTLSDQVRKGTHRFAPVVMITIGLMILLSH